MSSADHDVFVILFHSKLFVVIGEAQEAKPVVSTRRALLQTAPALLGNACFVGTARSLIVISIHSSDSAATRQQECICSTPRQRFHCRYKHYAAAATSRSNWLSKGTIIVATFSAHTVQSAALPVHAE